MNPADKGGLEIWKSRNLGIWKFGPVGNLEIQELCNLEIQKYGIQQKKYNLTQTKICSALEMAALKLPGSNCKLELIRTFVNKMI